MIVNINVALSPLIYYLFEKAGKLKVIELKLNVIPDCTVNFYLAFTFALSTFN